MTQIFTINANTLIGTSTYALLCEVKQVFDTVQPSSHGDGQFSRGFLPVTSVLNCFDDSSV